MKQIDIDIPEELYDKFVTKFGSEKEAFDYLSLRIEQAIRLEKWLIRQRPEQLQQKRKQVSIYMEPHLYPYLNELCIHRGFTRKEYVTRLIHKLSKKRNEKSNK
jgi:hypothetical protein